MNFPRPTPFAAACLLALGTLPLANRAAAQRSDGIPAAVTAGFTRDAPGATKVVWEVEGDGQYEAEFERDGAERSNTYTADGTLLESEEEIAVDALPAAVAAGVARDYADHRVTEAARIDYPDGHTAYEAELKPRGGRGFDALYAVDGRLIGKVAEDGGGGDEGGRD